MKLYMFREFLCPSSGVYSVYTRHWYMSNSFRAGPGWNCSSILVLLESYLQTCMTYTSAECTVHKLLMTVREMPETCRVSCRSKFGKLVHLVCFIIKKRHHLKPLNCLSGNRHVQIIHTAYLPDGM